jgi:hypothetical protein
MNTEIISIDSFSLVSRDQSKIYSVLPNPFDLVAKPTAPKPNQTKY